MAEKEVKGIKKFFEEFKAFAMRGNVLDMAVGVVVGGAFTSIVNSLVNDIINPAIGLFFNADFSDVGIHVGDVMIGIGSFINAIINFLIVAFVLFMVIKFINSLHKKPAEPEAPAEPTTAEYTVYNTTGSTVTELYLYDAGSDEKGDNLAGENGLADGENTVITRDVEADKQSDVTYILEFTTEDGQTQSFETLHYEVAPISLLSVDAAAGATPIAFTAPEK